MTTLRCDMESTCEERVTHLDKKGYVYCARHGLMRRMSQPCRVLRKGEIRRLESGQQISYKPAIGRTNLLPRPAAVEADKAPSSFYVSSFYVIKQILDDGSTWESIPFAADDRHAAQNVLAGYIKQTRWAERDGKIVYKIDERGRMVAS